MSDINMHASIYKDNARILQGILDTLREILSVPQGQSLVDAARRLVGDQVKPGSDHPGHVSAECYLRSRYGAYRGHFAWRELEEAFNAGMNSRSGVVPVEDCALESARPDVAKSHPVPAPVATVEALKPGEVSASHLIKWLSHYDIDGVVLVEDIWSHLQATAAGPQAISINGLKTRVRNRASAGAILVKDLTAIVETMAHAATNGAADNGAADGCQ